jgi:hypothetical protein
MAKIVSPAIKKAYVKYIKDTIEDLNRSVDVYLPPEAMDCPNCLYDPINKKSTGVVDPLFVTSVVIFGQTISPQSFTRGRCPICKGEGVLTSEVKRSVKCLVKWQPDGPDDLEIIPSGREGASVVRLKALPSNYNNFINAIYYVVDGTKCEAISSPNIRALGTTKGMVVVYLQEVEVGRGTNNS